MNRYKSTLFAVALLVVFVVAAYSQPSGSTGEIRGTVYDEQDAVIPDVKVVVKNSGTGLTRELVTDETGHYRALLLPVGTYEILVEKERFKKAEQKGIVVNVGDSIRLNFTLEVGEFTAVITVTADAPIVEPTRTTVSAVVTEELIENLPINGRDYRDFVLVTPTTGVSSRNGVVIGGSRGMYTNLTVDGADNNSPFFSEQNGGEINPTFTVSQESVKEFRVLNNGFNAEFGRSIGGLINVVTKSGTNEYRGSAFLYFQDESFVADQAIAINYGEDKRYDPADEFRRVQFGGSFGGPIQQDKAFFFLSTDIQRYEIPRVIEFGFPEAVEQQYDFLRNEEGTYTSTDDDTVIFAKLDYAFSQTHNFTARFNYSDADQVNGLNYYSTNALGLQGKEDESTTSTVATLTSLLGPDMINELRIQYSTNNIERVNNAGGPEINIASYTAMLGSTWYLPITIDIWRWQFSDNFNWLVTNHDVKFGIDWNITQTDEVFIGFSRGQVRFNSLDDYLAGDPAYALQKIPLGGRSMNESGQFICKVNEIAFYAQDKWQPTVQMTVDIGLRWEGTYNPDPPNPNPKYPLTNQLFDDTNNWQPRFGVAYDLFGDGRTVLRGAAGLFYGRTPSILYFNPFMNNGEVAVVQYVPGYRVPWPYDAELVKSWYNTAPSGLDIDYVSPDYQEAKTWRLNFGFERELYPNTSASFDFMYANGSHLMRRHDVNFNPPVPGASQHGRDLYDSRNRPNEAFGRIQELVASGEMEYYATTLMLKTRFYKGLSMQTSYTWSRMKDDDSNERSSGGNTYTEPFNPAADFGLSDYDRTHRFVSSIVWNAPYGINVSGIITAMSGRPYSADWGRDLNGDTQNDRAIEVGDDLVWVERNSYRMGAFKNVDLRISKVFNIDRYRIEGIFEAFNLFNWESETSVYSTSRYSSFGNPSGFQWSRRLQIGARVRF